MEKPIIYELDLDEIQSEKNKKAGLNRIAYTGNPAIRTMGQAFNKSREIQEKILNEIVYTEALRYAENTKQSVESLTEITEDEYLKAKEKVSFSNSPLNDIYTSQSILDFPDPSGDGIFMLRYSYEGPKDDKNRDFCSTMVSFSGNSVWTYEDITQDLSNPEFGTYNIFTYKGSYNCRHRWVRKFFYKDFDDREARRVGSNPGSVARGIGIGDTSATTTNQRVFTRFETNIDTYKRRVIAPAMIPDMLIEREDEEGKYFVKFTREAIERLQNNFQSKRLEIEFNVEHDENNLAPAYILEQWIIETPEDKTYSKYGFTQDEVPIGSWMVISQITDDEFFISNILEEKQYGYSVEGLFDMELIELNKNKNKNTIMKMEEFNEVVEIDGKKYTFSITDGKLEYHPFEEEDEKETEKETEMEFESEKEDEKEMEFESEKEEEKEMESETEKEDEEEKEMESDKEDENEMEEEQEEEKEYYTKDEMEEKLKGLIEMIAKLESEMVGKEKDTEEDMNNREFSMSFSDKIKMLRNLTK